MATTNCALGFPTDRRNLAEPFPGLVFLALRQQLPPHFLTHRPQRIELLVGKLGPPAHSPLTDLPRPLGTMAWCMDLLAVLRRNITSPSGLLVRFAEPAAKCRASLTRPHFRPIGGGPPRQRGFMRTAADSAEGELATVPPPPSPTSPSWDGKPPDQWIAHNFAEPRRSWARSKPSQHSLIRP